MNRRDAFKALAGLVVGVSMAPAIVAAAKPDPLKPKYVTIPEPWRAVKWIPDRFGAQYEMLELEATTLDGKRIRGYLIDRP